MSKRDQPYRHQIRSFDTVFSQSVPESASQSVPLESIRFPKNQPRRYFDSQKMEQLVLSVREHGILEPLLVRPLREGEYELVAGERRYRAAKEVGLREVPVVSRELTDEDAIQLALIENLQREDLNPVEETEGILHLLAIKLKISVQDIPPLLYRMQKEAKGKAAHNVVGQSEVEAIKSVFNSLGLLSWESFINHRLPLLNLPSDVLEALRQGEIAYTKAQAISRVKEEVQRKKLLKESIVEDLSLSQIRERIQTMRPEPDPHTPKVAFESLSRRLIRAKLWEDPKKWKRAQSLLVKLEALLSEE